MPRVLLSCTRSPWEFSGYEMPVCLKEVGTGIIKDKPHYGTFVLECQSTYADALGESRPLRLTTIGHYDAIVFNLDECLRGPLTTGNTIAAEVDHGIASAELLSCAAVTKRRNNLPDDRWRGSKMWPQVLTTTESIRDFLDTAVYTPLYKKRRLEALSVEGTAVFQSYERFIGAAREDYDRERKNLGPKTPTDRKDQ